MPNRLTALLAALLLATAASSAEAQKFSVIRGPSHEALLAADTLHIDVPTFDLNGQTDLLFRNYLDIEKNRLWVLQHKTMLIEDPCKDAICIPEWWLGELARGDIPHLTSRLRPIASNTTGLFGPDVDPSQFPPDLLPYIRETLSLATMR